MIKKVLNMMVFTVLMSILLSVGVLADDEPIEFPAEPRISFVLDQDIYKKRPMCLGIIPGDSYEPYATEDDEGIYNADNFWYIEFTLSFLEADDTDYVQEEITTPILAPGEHYYIYPYDLLGPSVDRYNNGLAADGDTMRYCVVSHRLFYKDSDGELKEPHYGEGTIKIPIVFATSMAIHELEPLSLSSNKPVPFGYFEDVIENHNGVCSEDILDYYSLISSSAPYFYGATAADYLKYGTDYVIKARYDSDYLYDTYCRSPYIWDYEQDNWTYTDRPYFNDIEAEDVWIPEKGSIKLSVVPLNGGFLQTDYIYYDDPALDSDDVVLTKAMQKSEFCRPSKYNLTYNYNEYLTSKVGDFPDKRILDYRCYIDDYSDEPMAIDPTPEALHGLYEFDESIIHEDSAVLEESFGCLYVHTTLSGVGDYGFLGNNKQHIYKKVKLNVDDSENENGPIVLKVYNGNQLVKTKAFSKYQESDIYSFLRTKVDEVDAPNGYKFKGYYFDKECTEEATLYYIKEKLKTENFIPLYMDWEELPPPTPVATLYSGHMDRSVKVNSLPEYVDSRFTFRTMEISDTFTLFNLYDKGYTFNGWRLVDEGATSYPLVSVSAVLEMNRNCNLVADWSLAKYDVNIYYSDGQEDHLELYMDGYKENILKAINKRFPSDKYDWQIYNSHSQLLDPSADEWDCSFTNFWVYPTSKAGYTEPDDPNDNGGEGGEEGGSGKNPETPQNPQNPQNPTTRETVSTMTTVTANANGYTASVSMCKVLPYSKNKKELARNLNVQANIRDSEGNPTGISIKSVKCTKPKHGYTRATIKLKGSTKPEKKAVKAMNKKLKKIAIEVEQDYDDD